MDNIMGFDDFIYVVKVYEDGKTYQYEFGNIKHAIDLLKFEQNAKLFKYNTCTQSETEMHIA